ncbi:MAG: PP2C family protein-serine/threonine phosphatase [Pseudomonadota bacterium]
MLRTRIMLIAVGIVTLIVGLFAYSVWLRDQASREEHDALRMALIDQAWELETNAATEQAAIQTLEILNNRIVIDAVTEDDQALLQAALGRQIEELIAEGAVVRLDIYSPDADLLYSSDPAFFAADLLGEIQTVPLEGDETVSGVRVNDGQILGILIAQLAANDERIGSAVISVDLEPSLGSLADLLDAHFVALDRSGAPLDSTAAEVFAPLLENIDPTQAQLIEGRLDDATHELTTTIAIDAGGGRGGTIVAIRDISELAAQRDLALLATIFWTLVLALVPLGLLWLYLSRSFRPLADAIDALTQLSKGRTDHYVELTSGADEIGQIGRSIEIFRQHALQIERNADLEERRRRRQARFIRRQMATLSETLDEEGQASALEDLQQIEEMGTIAGQNGRDAPEFSDELGLIGVALERMTTRVRTQQQAMNELIAELREALQMKTRLISLEQELEVARRMQQNILPRSFPELSEFTIAAQMRPAREVGGDFYDVFQLDDERIGIAIADVSGKGVPAAFFMLITRTLLKALALEELGPARTVARLNELLSAENEDMMFVTLFYAELEPAKRQLTYTNCGHNEPILVSTNEDAKPLATTDGVALAVFENLSFDERQITMTPGERLVLFTDGVTEAFDEGGEMFSDDRLLNLLSKNGEHDASTLLADILSAVDRFSGEAPQSDDITVIVLSAVDSDMRHTSDMEERRAAAAE